MFAYIKGILEDIDTTHVVLDVHGVGYNIIVPNSLLLKLPQKGELIKLYTYFAVKEDSHELYGFVDREEKKIFEKLISVSGIGPKGAIGILSTLNPPELALAIVTSDVKKLSSAPGIGKKTAQRIILELKEKIEKEDLNMQENSMGTTCVENDDINDVIQALIALGYQGSEAKHAIEKLDNVKMETSLMIKEVLKVLDRK